MSSITILNLVKMAIAACMLLCAIIVWRKTRDTTWVLMVFTAITWYVQIVLTLLEAVSLLPTLSLAVRIVIHSLPLLCFTIALITFNPDRDLF